MFLERIKCQLGASTSLTINAGALKDNDGKTSGVSSENTSAGSQEPKSYLGGPKFNMQKVPTIAQESFERFDPFGFDEKEKEVKTPMT